MRFVVALALLCGLCSLAFAKKEATNECRYGNNNKGFIQTFFSKKERIATVPCRLRLVDMFCGESGTKVSVTILNTADSIDNFLTKLEKVEVSIRHKTNKTGFEETNILIRAKKEAFQAAVEAGTPWEDVVGDLWNTMNEGKEKPMKGSEIAGSYDPKKHAAVVEFQGFKFELRLENDEIRIYCPKSKTGEGTHFPRTLCGHPDDTKKEFEGLVKAPESMDKSLVTGARWAVAMLSRQSAAEAGKDICGAAKETMEGKCDKNDKPNVLSRCDQYYSDLSGAVYGSCARQNDTNDSPMNPLTLYELCVRTLCHIDQTHMNKRTWKLKDDDCTFLNRLSRKCGNLKAVLANVGTLLDIGDCDRT